MTTTTKTQGQQTVTYRDYPVGTTVWQELEARSADGLADFYDAVLGWRLELDGDRGLFTRNGDVVAGVRIDPALDDGRIGWRCYLGADDLDAAVARAVAAGAVVQTRDKRIGIPGRAIELTDPFGAWFGLAEPDAGHAVIPSTELGRMSLVDPTNHDLGAEIRFQHALFPGQRVEALDHGIHFFRDEEGRALRGSYEVAEEARAFLPPHWLPWFNVVDQQRATEIAVERGGRVNTVDNELSFGLWGVVVDPAGGEFKVLQLTTDRL
ncbi:VOC family protein [Agromyces bracchium]|uniref:VOC domain-containing protein n=1 Tax=Agromyces bracchium TaxID=88376 RepID=A0A6I3MDG2_9MICO|nr:VOC family protein [Agromyces bracchium]MTH69436.1 hypothetical protein [Agromyces bracchium]